MNFLYHFHIASGNSAETMNNSAGMGHAFRCLHVSDYMREKFNHSSIFLVNRSAESTAFIQKNKILNYFYDDDLALISSRLSGIDCIVSDINYLDERYQDFYKNLFSKVICLAPRGSFKFKADMSFRDTKYSDINESHCSSRHYAGIEYSIISPKCVLARSSCIEKQKSIVVSMGGKDQFNMTMNTVKSLDNLDMHLDIIVGPLYEFYNVLNSQCLRSLPSFRIYKSPQNFFNILARSKVGIFASGLTTYEALCLGVVPFNIGHCDYHMNRSLELENNNLGFYLGDIRSTPFFFNLKSQIKDLFEDSKTLSDMINRSQAVVDGNGLERVCRKINDFLNQ